MVQQSDKFSIYGGYGFVLGEFIRQFPDQCIRIPKHEVVPCSPKIIYGISTTDNYNVYDNVTVDVETNLLHLMEVLDACHKTFGTNFTFNLISTWFVFGIGSTKESPHTEESYCDPKGFYSITARCREQLLISYCETFKIKYRILRLANVLGHRDGKVSAKKNAL
jgi:UDP-glucose 4-epimerase